ncbi:MAG: LUD domain-containing protein, partial [Gammaproteobacteria bacterium]|nr:LUD domain-containing protein [Gammaproteobacteria bacterium]
AREQVLSRVRTALGRGEPGDAQVAEIRARIERHPRHIEPVFDEPAPLRFRQKLEAAEASCATLDSLAQVGAEVERYLDQAGVAKRLVVSGDELLQSIDWPASIDVRPWVAGSDERVSLTSAHRGIAETGTLMLLSGENNPTRLNFLPDYHIVVLTADQLVLRMEDAWDSLRSCFGEMPRTVNFISGPSKTADVEQTVEYGAHGPRCLHVILVG